MKRILWAKIVCIWKVEIESLTATASLEFSHANSLSICRTHFLEGCVILHIRDFVTCFAESNACSSSPCVNGATCSERSGNYSCQCKSGWIRQNCAGKNDLSCCFACLFYLVEKHKGSVITRQFRQCLKKPPSKPFSMLPTFISRHCLLLTVTRRLASQTRKLFIYLKKPAYKQIWRPTDCLKPRPKLDSV